MPPFGPITRARQLNHHVSSFLSSCLLYLYNGNTHTLVFLRNDGEDKKERGSAWTRFAHDIFCGENEVARSVCDLSHNSNGGGTNGADYSILHHSRMQQKRRRSKRSCPSGFGPSMLQKLPQSITFYSGGVWRPMSTCCKDLEVYIGLFFCFVYT